MSISNTVEKKQLDVILKLNQLTHEGKLEWAQADDSKEMEDRYYVYS